MANNRDLNVRLGVQDGQRVLEELRQVGQQGGAAFDAIAEGANRARPAVDSLGRTIGGLGRDHSAGLHNLGFQLQDFFVQVQSGTPTVQALSQQLPQLASGFGLWGIAIGTAVPVLAMLYQHMVGAEEEAGELANVLDTVTTPGFFNATSAVEQYSAALAAATGEQAKFIAAAGELTIEQAKAEAAGIADKIGAGLADAEAQRLLETTSLGRGRGGVSAATRMGEEAAAIDTGAIRNAVGEGSPEEVLRLTREAGLAGTEQAKRLVELANAVQAAKLAAMTAPVDLSFVGPMPTFDGAALEDTAAGPSPVPKLRDERAVDALYEREAMEREREAKLREDEAERENERRKRANEQARQMVESQGRDLIELTGSAAERRSAFIEEGIARLPENSDAKYREAMRGVLGSVFDAEVAKEASDKAKQDSERAAREAEAVQRADQAVLDRIRDAKLRLSEDPADQEQAFVDQYTRSLPDDSRVVQVVEQEARALYQLERAREADEEATKRQAEAEREWQQTLDVGQRLMERYATAQEARAMQLAELESLRNARGPDGERAIDDRTYERARVDIERDALDRSEEFSDSWRQGFMDIEDSVGSLNDSVRYTMAASFDMATASLTNFLLTGKNGFDELKDQMLEMATNEAIRQFLSMAIGGAIGSFGSDVPPTQQTPTMIGGPGGMTRPYAKGGAFVGGREVYAFAQGGIPGLEHYRNQIVSSPTYFAFANGAALGEMGEAGDEGIVPLKRMRSGNLGVETSGGGTPVLNVVVNNNAGVEIETRQRQTPSGPELEIIVNQAVKRGFRRGDFTKEMAAYGGKPSLQR